MTSQILAVFFSLAAPAAGGPDAIRIGAALPLSGPEAKSGARQRDGFQLAVDLANEAGGVDLNGRRVPVKLEVVDDKSDGPTDAREVEGLVERGNHVLLGTFSTPLVEVGSATAERLKVPYVASSGASRALYKRGFKYLFSVTAPIDQLANALLRWADDQQQLSHLPSPARVAIVWEKTSHGKEYAEGVHDFVEKTPRRGASWQIVMDASFELNTKDFGPLLRRLREARADVLLVDAHVPDYIAMHAQYEKTGLCHKMISYGARGPEIEAREQLKSGSDYITSAVWWSPQMMHGGRGQEFIARFKARYGRTPEWYEALGFEAARALLEAIHKAGSIDREAVRVALETLRMESIMPSGTLTFPEHYGRQAQYLFVVQQNMPDGTSPIVYPKIAAVKEGIAPNPHCAPAKTASSR